MKDMKWLYNMVITFFAAGCLTACSDYLEVDSNFKDRLTIEKVFTDKDYTDAWLSNTYSYLRGQNQDVGGKESVPTNFADDIYWADWNDAGNGKSTNGSYYSFFRNVEYNENWYQDSYKASYLGINKACVFLNNIHMNQQLTDEERADYAAQARFVRAYYYWLLLRKYGPIPLIPDEGEDYMQDYDGLARPRNTYDECVEYITSELVKAAQDLPLERGANNIARPTRGAALAARAKVLLYAASPLMNGNTDSYAQQMVDDKGNRLLAAEYDESKWAKAAAAARDVMELPGNNDGHRYQLYVKSRITSGTEDYPETIEPFKDRNFSENNWPYGYADIDPFESYRSVFNGELSAHENPELIFSRVDNITVDNSSGGITSPDAIANMVLHQLPTLAGGWGVHGMTQKQCDAYYMNDGTDCPGKDKEIGRGDGSSRLTGYVTSDDVDAGRYKPLRAGVSLQYANREPRFYASVGFNGSVWNMTSLGNKQGATQPNQQVWYYRGTSEGYNGGNRIFTGIGIKKYVNPYDAKYQNELLYRQKAEPAIRYAEILLIYAEALNELGEGASYDIPSWDGSITYTVRRDVEEMKKGIQPVRIRAGVPDYSPTEYQNQDVFRKKLKRERQIELMGENHRYYDLRRWKIDAPLEEETLIYGCNMLMDDGHKDLFHTPVAIMSLPVRFVEKSYFWPFSHEQLQRNKRLTQNPGWTYYD